MPQKSVKIKVLFLHYTVNNLNVKALNWNVICNFGRNGEWVDDIKANANNSGQRMLRCFTPSSLKLVELKTSWV